MARKESTQERYTRETLAEAKAAGGENFEALVKMILDGHFDEAVAKCDRSEFKRILGNAHVTRFPLISDEIAVTDTFEVGDVVHLHGTSPKWLTHVAAVVTGPANAKGEIPIRFHDHWNLGRYARNATIAPSRLRKVTAGSMIADRLAVVDRPLAATLKAA